LIGKYHEDIEDVRIVIMNQIGLMLSVNGGIMMAVPTITSLLKSLIQLKNLVINVQLRVGELYIIERLSWKL